MKVYELLEILSHTNPDADVVLYGTCDYCYQLKFTPHSAQLEGKVFSLYLEEVV